MNDSNQENGSQADSGSGAVPWHLVKSLLALAVIAIVIAWQADAFKAKTAPGTSEAEGPKAKPDAVITVTSAEVAGIHRLSGQLVARHPVNLLARSSGELRELYVEAGSQVESGELLAVLDGDKLRASRDEAAAALAVVEAERDGAARLSRRIEAAAEARALAETDAIDARRTLEGAKNRVEQARAALRAAELRVDDARLRSPMEGIVIDTYKNPGEWLAPGQVLLRLYDPRQKEIELAVPSALAKQLQPGFPLSCWIEALDTEIRAQVRTVVPMADPASRSVLVKLSLEPPQGALPGMYVSVHLEGEARTLAIVPLSAVKQVRQLNFVSFVNPDGRVTPRWVRLGRSLGDSVSILAGLRPGDRILRRYHEPGDGPDGVLPKDLPDHE